MKKALASGRNFTSLRGFKVTVSRVRSVKSIQVWTPHVVPFPHGIVYDFMDLKKKTFYIFYQFILWISQRAESEKQKLLKQSVCPASLSHENVTVYLEHFQSYFSWDCDISVLSISKKFNAHRSAALSHPLFCLPVCSLFQDFFP